MSEILNVIPFFHLEFNFQQNLAWWRVAISPTGDFGVFWRYFWAIFSKVAGFMIYIFTPKVTPFGGEHFGICFIFCTLSLTFKTLTGSVTLPSLLSYWCCSKINDHKSKINIKAPIIYFANIEIQSEPMLGNQLV